MTRLALGIEYDGTDWNGWQTQPGGKTIQDALERALKSFTEADHPTICAGRTDAGVLARGQLVHIDTSIERLDWSWVRGLNALLPASIAIRWAQPVSDDFHARFSATAREYSYRIFHSPTRSPMEDRFSTWFYRPLDIEAMRQAARLLIGRHDFSAFRSSECQAASPIRDLMICAIETQGQTITLRLKANAFLHHMVRNIVGSIVEVGRGAQPVNWLSDVLASGDRRLAARTFPAEGLCLERVEYDSSLLCEPESKFVD
ncbi:MAG: pseudouridylate synthase [Pseudomonadota bacterium]